MTLYLEFTRETPKTIENVSAFYPVDTLSYMVLNDKGMTRYSNVINFHIKDY